MLANFPSPVLNVSADVLKDLDGSEALTGLWFLFTKCQSSLNEGRRLENISWRLWSQQMAGRSAKYRPLTPESPSEEIGTPALCSGRPSIGKVIYEILPNSQHSEQNFHARLRLPISTPKVELEVETSTSSLLPTPAAELSISIIPPVQSNTAAVLSVESSNDRSRSVSPTIRSHAISSPPTQSSSNSGTSLPVSPFPVVVVVNPTPNPTPHPTPPATPILPATVPSTDSLGSIQVQPPMLSPGSPTSSRDRRQPSLFLAPTFDSSPSFQPGSPAASGSRSPTLLPPSPHTSSSLMSVSSGISHLTTSSSTSIHSNDARSPNATLKPSDARIFFLKHGDENSSGSSDERSRSPVRPAIFSSDVAQLRNPSAATSEHSGYSTENLNRTANGSYPSPMSRLSRQQSDGQGSTSASGSMGGSWGESDGSDEHRMKVKCSKSSRRGSANGHASGSSDSKSRSRSRGPSAHNFDGLMMSSRKKASKVTHTGVRKGARFGGVVHANGQAPSQAHDSEQGTRQRVQGQRAQTGRDSSNPGQSNFSPVQESDRVHKRPNGVQQQHPYSRQVPAQALPSTTTLGKRPMFNIGSQSPGDSPSNTDLSTSSQANTKSISPLAGEIKTKLVSPPAGPLTRVRTQGHLLSRPTLHPQQPPPPPVLAKTNNSSPRQPRRLPHATANLSEAEAMIQAPRTKKVVLADDDEDDDDWDETETDLDSDFEELDRKSHIDAEKGGTLVEPGMLATGSGDNDENGDWEDEDGSGSDDAVSAAPRNAKKNVASPPPAAANNQNPKRPGPSRHQSQPNIPTLASISKPKQQVIVEQESCRPPPHPAAGPSRPSRRSDREQQQQQQQPLDKKLYEAALEAQRQRELFTKMPKRSYSNLSTRSQSGLLSQLMNPDPQIFPDSHPYKRGYSSGDVAAGGRPVARMGIQAMATIMSNGEVKSNLSAGAPPKPSGSGVMTNGAAAAPYPSPSRPSLSTMGGLKPSKSAAALPVANSVTASSYMGDVNGFSDRANGKEKQGESNGSAGMYRPKARPRDEDLEDESEDDPEQALQISQSAAHEKLAAFADRRTAKASAAPGAKVGSSSRAPPPPVLPLYANPVPGPQPLRSQSQYVGNAHETISTPPVQVPLPLGFPYNLPPAAPPSTPRTTRRVMLQKEMPEELLHNLLWSRRVLKQELAGPRRASSSALSPGLRPLTALPTNPVVQLTEKKKRPDGEPESKANTDDEDDLLEADQILRPAKMTRNRSWAGGGR